ncbi:MAG: hypothetical protein RL149_371, partial [Actinomycetota bacterium]
MAAKNDATPEVATYETKQSFNFNSLSTLAVVSLATALTGFGAIAAIITGHFALAQIKQQHRNGRGLAIAGIAIGYATLAIWIIGAIAMAVLRVRYGFSGVTPMDGFRF